MLRAVSLGLVLAALWLVLSGHFVPFLLSLGLASVVVTVFITRRMDMVDMEGQPFRLAAFAPLTYWPWLFWEIARANWDVAKIILSPQMSIRPHVFDTPASQTTEAGRVTYANSITLTPGTVTLAMATDGTLTIHALTDAAREGVETLDMDRRCTVLEGPKQASPVKRRPL